LNAFGEIPLTDYAVHLNRPLIEGVIARMTKDDAKARAAFTAARAEQEKAVQSQPNYGPALCALGLIDAGLGRNEEALREGREPPRVLPVIGAGILARVDPLPDGRSNIVLRGVRRARIVEELSTQEPYRLVRAEALAEPFADAAFLARSAEQLRQMVLAVCARHPGAAATALAQMAGSTAAPGDLADAVGAMILESPEERQHLLETASAEDRLRRVTQHLAATLAQAQPGHGTLLN